MSRTVLEIRRGSQRRSRNDLGPGKNEKSELSLCRKKKEIVYFLSNAIISDHFFSNSVYYAGNIYDYNRATAKKSCKSVHSDLILDAQ
jgi:hypothetical protein